MKMKNRNAHINILMVPNLYFPNIGGVEIAVENLSKQFLSHGNYVEIATSRWPNKLARVEYIENIKVNRLPFRLPLNSIKSYISFFLRTIFCTYRMMILTKKVTFDIINIHYLSENAFPALLIHHLRKVPLVTSIHGADIEDFAERNRINRLIVKLVLNKSELIIANSKYLVNKMLKAFGSNLIRKTTVIGNGVTKSIFVNTKFRIPDYKPYILGVGRFVYKKGFDILIKAFVIVKEKNPDLKLILIGDGKEKECLRKLCDEYNIKDSVIFKGSMSSKDVIRYYYNSEIFVLPSRNEPFGIVCLEAMAAGKPVIAMNVGGVGEYLTDLVNGILVNNYSHIELAKMINAVLTNKSLSKTLGRNAKKIVRENYTWDKVYVKYIKAYLSILK